MVMSATSEVAGRELDRRSNYGFDVMLLWDPETNGVSVAVEDQRYGFSLSFQVDPADALDAFQHPFAYASNDNDAPSLPLELCLPTSGDENSDDHH
jgi:hypothetical protein